MSRNLFLDPTTKDLALTSSNNLRITSTNSEFMSQKIENKFLFQFGEWYLNQTKGIPYIAINNSDRDSNIKNIMVKNPDLNFINGLFKSELVTMQRNGEIDEIVKFNTSYNTSSRSLSITFTVRIDNETVSGTITI